MVSLIIPVIDDEPALLDTLAACVTGVAEGVIRDAVVVSPALSETMGMMADAAGCKQIQASGGREALISAAGRHARSDWWLVLSPGLVPVGPWPLELATFIENAVPAEIGVTRLTGSASLSGRIGAGFLPWLARLTGKADPRLGLVIHRTMWGQDHSPASGHRFVTLNLHLRDRRN